MVADSCGWGWSGGPHVKQSTCLCRSVAQVLPGWRLHWRLVHGSITWCGSVQSQQWLHVLIFSLLFMFQGASFYHRLRSNKRGRKHRQSQSVHAGNGCYSPWGSRHRELLLFISFLVSVFHTSLYFWFSWRFPGPSEIVPISFCCNIP